VTVTVWRFRDTMHRRTLKVPSIERDVWNGRNVPSAGETRVTGAEWNGDLGCYDIALAKSAMGTAAKVS
jgi:hypothetical protein